jgi:hypothetical protein
MKYFHGWWVCHTTIDNFDDFNWCCEQFGKPEMNRRWFYNHVERKFYFGREEDAMWYTLRWSA